ncbi:MAG: serine acetyltransferase [Symploca sp. SIO3E6]|nr:serine acetyltransferase [Caldora sp. SIO3E6]
MNNLLSYLLQDWQTNQDTSLKSRLTLLLFRSAQITGNFPKIFKIISIIYCFLYQVIIEWLLGIEIPWDTQIGSKLKLQHGHALVVNHYTIIGANCTLRHSTTIGNKKLADGSWSACPKIGDNVDIGSNVVILGPITIGNNAVIGAGSVVVKDIPAGVVVVGNPARIIRTANNASSILEAEIEATKLASASKN